jgi:hypothetical protein
VRPCAAALDKKIAMLMPGVWMFVLMLKQAALNKLQIVANLVMFGYLLHIVVDYRR